MNADQDTSNQLDAYAEVLGLLEKNVRYLEALGFGEETIHDYRQVLHYLKAKSPSEVAKILGKAIRPKKARAEPDLDWTDDHVGSLDEKEVRRVLADADVSRRFLERLASLRFGVTKGALSTLRSRNALKEKIETLLSHEGTHVAISRAASGQADENLGGVTEKTKQ
ncbi:MAG: hypothetical protein V4795_14575 [Pseudomonadota bacterium]